MEILLFVAISRQGYSFLSLCCCRSWLRICRRVMRLVRRSWITKREAKGEAWRRKSRSPVKNIHRGWKPLPQSFLVFTFPLLPSAKGPDLTGSFCLLPSISDPRLAYFPSAWDLAPEILSCLGSWSPCLDLPFIPLVPHSWKRRVRRILSVDGSLMRWIYSNGFLFQFS